MFRGFIYLDLTFQSQFHLFYKKAKKWLVTYDDGQELNIINAHKRALGFKDINFSYFQR